MNKDHIIIGTAAAAIMAIGAGLTLGAHSRMPAADTSAAITTAAAATSVAVITQPLQRKEMAATVTAYGDVAPGATQAVSSAYAAQIVRLAVMQGQTVKKGALLVELAADPAGQLAYEQAQSGLRLADAELARLQSLAKLQLATQSQVDIAQKTRNDASAALASQTALGGGAGSRVIKAPADGMVLALTALQGDRVQPGAPIMQFGVTSNVKILLGVDPAESAHLHQGAAVSITALTQGAETVTSVISEVQNLIDPKTQLINAVVRLPLRSSLSPGMRVRAEIVAERRQAYEVPRQAVLSDEQGNYVFQVKDKQAHRVAVEKLVNNRNSIGVDGAIDPHLPLVVLGNYELKDGMAVREGTQ
jgi:RND family efflux transporter MFP subunit